MFTDVKPKMGFTEFSICYDQILFLNSSNTRLIERLTD
jgi:hypothetical protein